MRRNPVRRTALVDAAIDVLADIGARGLTFRAVDARAEVPVGTASNYFANRDELFAQIGGRIFERLGAVTVPAGADSAARLRHLVDHVAGYREGYLALLELRLEATRRPELRAALTETIRADVAANVAAHERAGPPGDATTVIVLYLAMNWLVVERLTLPDVFPDAGALVDVAVERILR
ncbi:MAG: TetR family transcriptional regulator [Actinophytocola sp.]|uniref:TetR/AcrR family transcriptional regulator n=1 Tax=Actinophytocola sp. TaxID=1872138 RepID=UPI001324B46A|nr:TetR/AcrR family transcriptional regulator [Actinophytocola sp.]MPZ84994.1 TetR family transcriptional regulator [Actinophytocola sp.]